MIDRAIRRLNEMHISVTQIVRWLALIAAVCTGALAAGSTVILTNAANPASELAVSRAYPPMFCIAAVAWLVVAFYPTPGWCSLAASIVAVPALIRSGDFALTWYQNGTDRPGSQLVGISGWALVATLSILVGILVPILDHRRQGA